MKLMLFLAFAIFYSFVSINQSNSNTIWCVLKHSMFHIHLENSRSLAAQYQLCDLVQLNLTVLLLVQN